jgi:hypothetical protein
VSLRVIHTLVMTVSAQQLYATSAAEGNTYGSFSTYSACLGCHECLSLAHTAPELPAARH